MRPSSKIIFALNEKMEKLWLRLVTSLAGLLVLVTAGLWLSRPRNALHLLLAIYFALIGSLVLLVSITPAGAVAQWVSRRFPFLTDHSGCTGFHAVLGMLALGSAEFVRFGIVAFVTGVYLLLLSAIHGIQHYQKV